MSRTRFPDPLRAVALSAAALLTLAAPLAARDVKGALAARERIALTGEAAIAVEVRAGDRIAGALRAPTGGAQMPLPFTLDLPEGAGQVLTGFVLVEGQVQWLSGPVALPETGDVDLGLIRVTRHEPAGFAPTLDCGVTRASLGFTGSDGAMLTLNGESLALRRDPLPAAVPGTRFTDGADAETAIWLDGDRARLALRGEAPVDCAPAADALPLPFIARGNEPGWVLNVTAEGVALSREDGGGAEGGPLPPGEENEAGTRYAIGDSLAFTVQPGLCHDTMSDLPWPATVLVEQEGEMLNGCGGDPLDLLKGDWTALRIGETDVPEGIEVTLSFDGGRISGRSGCNRYTGAVGMTGESLRLGPLAGTMMACPDPAMAVERAFHSALSAVDRFDIGPEGELLLIAGDVTLLTARR